MQQPCPLFPSQPQFTLSPTNFRDPKIILSMEGRTRGRKVHEIQAIPHRRSSSSSSGGGNGSSCHHHKKVQIVYYVSQNGHLQHPHFLELSLSLSQPLRLRHVVDRLAALRGPAMPSLYSWSSKRSYKGGYVWNDLTEDDIIYPSQGSEYVLKGSELFHHSSERLENLQIKTTQKSINNHPNHNKVTPTRRLTIRENQGQEEEEEEEDDCRDDDDIEENASYTGSSTPNSTSQCSKRATTTVPNTTTASNVRVSSSDNTPPKIEAVLSTIDITNTHYSPPPSTSSTISNKAVVGGHQLRVQTKPTSAPNRFNDSGALVNKTRSMPSRNSALLQLIACGGSVGGKGSRGMPCLKQQLSCNEGSNYFEDKAKTEKQKNVIQDLRGSTNCKEAEMIRYISENPRFGNIQREEKEFFSGSILEAINHEFSDDDHRVNHHHDHMQGEIVGPILKKSSSYNEERGSKGGLGEATTTEEVEKQEKVNVKVKAKCIPRRKSYNY